MGEHLYEHQYLVRFGLCVSNDCSFSWYRGAYQAAVFGQRTSFFVRAGIFRNVLDCFEITFFVGN